MLWEKTAGIGNKVKQIPPFWWILHPGAERTDSKASLLRHGSRTIILALVTATIAHAQFSPALGSPFAVGSAPRSVAVADINGDGKPDLVAANFNGNNITVLLGNGSGGFTAAPGSPFVVGTNPQSVAAADFNGDGKPDLVTANLNGNNITVLLGNGSGGFTAAPGSPFAVGISPIFVAVGDFNRDGKLDIVTANSGDNTATELLGDGSGGFVAAPGSPFVVGMNPASVAVGDFNGDGKLDIVTANSGDNTATELLGDGSGGFAAAAGSPFAVGTNPRSVVVGDFNGDGELDFVMANAGGNSITELLGNGTGGFTPATGNPFAVGTNPVSIAVADFNGDGKPDLAIANLGDNTATVLLNTLPAITTNPSSLTFYAGVGQAAPAVIPVSVSSAAGGSTYSASSNQSWLVPTPPSNSTSGVTTVHLSASAVSLTAGVYAGTVRYTAPDFFDAATAVTFSVANPSGALHAAVGSPFTVGAAPQSMAVGDFNGDGQPDLVVANSGDNTVTILLGNGMGGFAAAAGSPFAVGAAPQSVAVGDFNGDGQPDLVVANSGDNTVTILLGNGMGGFTAATGSPFAVGTTPESVAVADFNGDGKPDIVTANNGANDLTILLGDGTGGFAVAPGSPFALGLFPQSVAVGDFNGDGKPDLVAAISGNNTVRVLLGNGSGGFTGGGAFAVGSFPQSVAVADLNGDGKLDIVSANSGNNTITVLLGNGAGGFTAAAGSPFTVGTHPQSVAVVDINGDGNPDIVSANSGNNTITVLLGNGAGGFAAAAGSPFAAGTTPAAVAAGDFNGDGRPDIAIADLGEGTVSVLSGTQAATSSALSTTAASTVTYGTSVPLTLVVTGGGFGAPAGTGSFLDGGMAIGTAIQTASPYLFATTSLAVGIHTLTATYSGDPAAAASSSNAVMLTVTQASQTITFGALSNKAMGVAPFTIVATASSGLAVTFTSTTLPVCTVVGATVTLMSAGTCMIQATQPGSTNYAAAPSVSQHFTVTQGAQTIAFASLANQAFGTAPFTVSATASSGLAVTFTSMSSAVCTIAGAMVTLVSLGTCTIQASQAGNANYAAALSVSQHFSVTAASQTITFSALSAQVFGTAPFTISATASSGLAVSFTSTTLPVCTLTGATVKLLIAGTCTIQASQAGNISYAAAMPVIQSFTVTPESQTIAFGALPNKPFGAATLTVSATASSGLAVSFISTTSSVCTVAGSTVTMVSVGTCTIEASQAGNSSYSTATPVDQSFTVSQATQTINFGALPNKVFGSAPFAISATASSGLAVSFASNSAVCSVSGSASGATVIVALAGTCTIQATQGGNTNYSAATAVDQSFTVTQESQTVTFGALASQSFRTGQLAVSATASSGLAVGFTSTTASVCTAVDTTSGAAVTLLSTGICTIQATQPGNTNYAAATPVSQKFTVTQASQTITFGAIPNRALGTGQLPIGATASSGLAVSFTSTTSSVCTAAGTASGAMITLLTKGTCTIQASQAGNTNYTAAKPVAQTFTVIAGTLTIGAVLNAGSYAAIPIAPDAFMAAFGTDFSTATAQTNSLGLPATLAGATVTVTDSTGVTQTAPLFYVSPTQINFVVPEGLADGSATVTVTNPAGSQVSFATTIAQISPSLFTADSSGKGAPAALALAYASGAASPQVTPVFNCTGPPLVCAPAPIDLGPPSTTVYLELYGTGIRGRTGLSGVSVTLGGTALQVSYAGAQPTYAGLDQVNVLLDRSLIGQGPLTLQLTVDGVQANPVIVSIE
jgi:uncharacterized protein (TIGR03437 family)